MQNFPSTPRIKNKMILSENFIIFLLLTKKIVMESSVEPR